MFGCWQVIKWKLQLRLLDLVIYLTEVWLNSCLVSQICSQSLRNLILKWGIFNWNCYLKKMKTSQSLLMGQLLKSSFQTNLSQRNSSNFVDLQNLSCVAECLQSRNQISLSITWSQRKEFAFQLGMERMMFLWSCRLILESVSEVWRVHKLSDLQILQLMSSKVWRNSSWFMDDGDINESHGWSVTISIKILCLLFQKFTLPFIMDFQDKSYSWTGFQRFITQCLHHMHAFLHFH